MKKSNWIFIPILVINFIAGILLLISLASVYIDPITLWWPAIAGLMFPQIFLTNLAFFFLWLILNRKFALISLVFIVFGLSELPKHFQLNFSKSDKGNQFKILSMNVRNFDLYNWSENKQTRDKILSMINESGAEIICLQEFFNTTDPKHDFKTLDTILQFQKHYEKHVEYTTTVKDTEHWGIATFAAFPVLSQGRIEFEENSNNIAIYTDLFMGRDTLRVYNLHLASVRFGQDEYEYIERVVEEKSTGDLEASKGLISKLKLAFQKRSLQAEIVSNHIAESPYPVVVCGDFNDTPTSYAYGQISNGLKDSYTERGSGFGTTYNGDLPGLRIDYIFADPYISILEHKLIRTRLSDHYPIQATLEIQE